MTSLESNPENDIEYFRLVRNELVAHVPTGPNRVLEVGCGTGATLEELRRTGKASEIVGVDVMPFDTNLDHFIAADIEEVELPFPQEYFDILLCPDVLEHLRDPWRVLRQLTGHLKIGGCAIISVPNIRYGPAMFQIIARGRFPRHNHGVFDRTHLRWFCRGDVVELLEQANLDDACFHFSPSGGKKHILSRMLFNVAEEFLTRQHIVVATKVEQTRSRSRLRTRGPEVI